MHFDYYLMVASTFFWFSVWRDRADSDAVLPQKILPEGQGWPRWGEAAEEERKEEQGGRQGRSKGEQIGSYYYYISSLNQAEFLDWMPRKHAQECTVEYYRSTGTVQ